MRNQEAPAPTTTTRPIFITVERFLQRPESNLPEQLIQGYVVRDPAPGVPHQLLVGRLHLILHGALGETGQGLVLVAPVDVVLSRQTVLQPDVLVIRAGRQAVVGDRVEGPPDLVVEVESPTTRERDLTIKRMLYAQSGVPEYWFVSGAGRFVLQMTEPSGDDYSVKVVHGGKETLRSTTFPDLRVRLAALWDEPAARTGGHCPDR